MTHRSTSHSNGSLSSARSRIAGIFFDEFDSGSAWIRERGTLEIPALVDASELVLELEYIPHPTVGGLEGGCPALTIKVDGTPVSQVRPALPGRLTVPIPFARVASGQRSIVTLKLEGVGTTNFLAWLGRVTGWAWCSRFRLQNRNRQLRIRALRTGTETIYDFSDRHSPLNLGFERRRLHLGLNIAGYLTADLGIGESARCMVRAADAADLPAALIDLKLPVKSPTSDQTYRDRLQESNPYPVNVVHLDPPGAKDIDHHHGRSFRNGKYNIGYWAWELPEFPDSWAPYFSYYDEIWCPSDFVREAISLKSPVPVLTMPHSIAFHRPTAAVSEIRSRLDLPKDRFLFLFVYDLNSYSVRKNPQAVLQAFHRSGLADRGCSLVVKVHGVKGNENELAALQDRVAGFPGTTLVTGTLSRGALYELQAACDCFVSLHRSEGFGLSVAECMYLGKPVIATNWSATAEFLDASTGAPVDSRIIKLQENIGPYAKGQSWADPDIDHAADWMRRIHADPALRLRLGAAARARIEERFSPAVVGARYRRRLEAIALS